MATRNIIAALLSDDDEVGNVNEVRAPISRQVLRKLFKRYGRSPAVVELFNSYADLKDLFEDQSSGADTLADPDMYVDFRRSLQRIDNRISKETTRARVEHLESELAPFLRRLSRGPVPMGVWRKVIQDYSDLIQALANDKGIYTSTRRLPGGAGGVRWLRIQRSSAKEEAVEKLRNENPDLYDLLREEKVLNQEIRTKLFALARARGIEPSVRPVAGVPVVVGTDPVSGDGLVFDRSGKTLSFKEFTDQFREKAKERKSVREAISGKHGTLAQRLKLLQVNPTDRGDQTLFRLAQEFSDEQLAQVLSEQKEVFQTLTDDPENLSLLTQVLPTVTIDGDSVVSRGKYKGFRLRNLVNEIGRLVEGSSYYRDPVTNRVIRRSKTWINPETGQEELVIGKQSAPFVTASGEKDKKGRLIPATAKFHMKVGMGREYGVMRRELNVLAAKKGSTVSRFGRRATMGWEFEAKDFGVIQNITGEMAMSNGARKVLEEYFEDLARAERASQARNLTRYNSERLGLRLPLRQHVKKALAWMDANGNKGIVALDTGMGKTVMAIAAMIKMHKQGLTQGNNGRFLYVCDKNLVGNLPGEIHKFLESEDAADLLGRVDVIPYNRTKDSFTRRRSQDTTFGDDYAAIFFDEAHLYMKKKSQGVYKAAVSCKCPHKVLTTASPMVKSPREVYTMASVANSLDLNEYENRLEEGRFVKLYADDCAGRVTTIKRDEEVRRAFETWAKRNLFFEAKTNVAEQEGQVSELERTRLSVAMPEDIVRDYQREARAVRKGMKELLYKYRDNPMLAYDEVGRKPVSNPLKQLTRLIDVPNRVIPGTPNPKIDQSVEIVMGKIGGADRVMLWTDSPELAEDTFDRMRMRFPSQGHVLALSNSIFYSDAANKVHKYTMGNFARRFGKKNENGELIRVVNPNTGKRTALDPRTGEPLNSREWQAYIFRYVLGMGNKRTDNVIKTATLTGGYAVGQNLQSFATVVHLDRDGWSNETMKQRTARAWRAGNREPVEEITIDIAFPEGVGNKETLDDIRRLSQEMDEKLFTQVVLDSQKANLGEEWFRIKSERSESFRADKRVAALALQPLLEDYNREMAEADFIKEQELRRMRMEEEAALANLEASNV
jgi:hypothetical protein